MGKALGVLGTVTIGGVNYQAEGSGFKFEMEKNEYTPMGAGAPNEAWTIQVPGGVKKVTGTIEFAFDDSVTGGGQYPAPMSDSLVNISFQLSLTHSLTFQAALYDYDLKKASKGLVKVTAGFESSGAVTYA